jgi:hypothetical protein
MVVVFGDRLFVHFLVLTHGSAGIYPENQRPDACCMEGGHVTVEAREVDIREQ